MEKRRFILFLTLSMAILFGWSQFIAFRQAAEKAKHAGAGNRPNVEAEVEPLAPGEVAAKDAKQQHAAADGSEQPAEDKPLVAADKPDDANQPANDAQEAELPRHRHDTVVLGTTDPESGYFMQVTLTTKGASVVKVELNDPRYRDLNAPDEPLWLVGNTVKTPRTFDMSVPQVDEQLEPYKTSLKDLDWQILKTTADANDRNIRSSVTFRIASPDKKFEILKRYELKKVPTEQSEWRKVRDEQSAGYQLDFALTIRNRSDDKQVVTYTLQGPVGLPLENAANSHKFRDIKLGFLEDDGQIDPEAMTASEVVKAADKNDLDNDKWKRPLKYIGVDVQYFAVLLLPVGDQLQDPYIAVARPVLIEKKAEINHSDLSFELTSRDLPLAGGGEITHAYTFYAGPKRQALLEPLGAADTLDYGWFGPVAKAMLWLLKMLHDSLLFPYGIAIICLTIMVRGCMFPISKKQAAGAKKMKELQPKIAELKKKHGKDKEKMARAQMELFSKNNYNPFAGCLPVFLQLPIFIGLYTALNNAVDLRGQPFLWIKNLAAPDALFPLPFVVPFVGWTEFNLLPIITVALFVLQQKMFMPPPAPDDEQAQMQHKMMKYMMIFMGFLFYKMPAGLCVYFIASSLWGMGERKLLDFGKPKPNVSGDAPPPKPEKKTEKSNGIWNRLVEAAEAGASQTRSNGKSTAVKQPRTKKRKRR